MMAFLFSKMKSEKIYNVHLKNACNPLCSRNAHVNFLGFVALVGRLADAELFANCFLRKAHFYPSLVDFFEWFHVMRLFFVVAKKKNICYTQTIYFLIDEK